MVVMQFDAGHYVVEQIADLPTIAASLAPGDKEQSQDKPSPLTERQATTQQTSPDEILVVAPTGANASIDRQTYVVRRTPETRTLSAQELIARTPGVEVAQSGQLRLLGQPGVRVLINGNSNSGTMTQLRSLPADQIAKIEVISNPSAQFGGSGPIINIVLRTDTIRGLTGTTTLSEDHRGSDSLRAGINWSDGQKWTLTGSAFAESAHLPSETARTITFSSSSASNFEHTSIANNPTTLSGNLIATFRTGKLTATASGSILHNTALSLSTGTSSISSMGGSPTAWIGQGDTRGDAVLSELGFTLNGNAKGERLTGKLALGRFESSDRSIFLSTEMGSSQYVSELDLTTSNLALNLDYERPVGAGSVLKLGLGHNSEDTNASSLFTRLSNSRSFFSGSMNEYSAYATWEFPVWGSRVQLGLRSESHDYLDRLTPESGTGQNWMFLPSFHVERKLGKSFAVLGSYSRKAGWPELRDTATFLRPSGFSSATTGSPYLQPEVGDTFELKMRWKPKSHQIELALTNRSIDNVISWDASSSSGEEVLLTRSNVGSRELLGLSLFAKGNLSTTFGYNISASHWSQSFCPQGLRALCRRSDQNNFSIQLEYREVNGNKPGGDAISARIGYSGSLDLGSATFPATLSSTISWTHLFSNRLSAVALITNPLGRLDSKTAYLAPGKEILSQNLTSPTIFRLSIIYTFGRSDR